MPVQAAPKYSFGNLVTDKLFKSKEEIADAKAAKELAGMASELEASREAAPTDDPQKIEEYKKAYENATEDVAKTRYGVTYLKSVYPNYSEYIDAIADSVSTEGIDAKNPHVEFIDKNGDGADLADNKNFISWIVKAIDEDSDIVNDKDSYIYNSDIQKKTKTLSSSEATGFLTFIDTLSDDDKLKKYFANIPDQVARKQMISELSSLNSFKEMKTKIDEWQNTYNAENKSASPGSSQAPTISAKNLGVDEIKSLQWILANGLKIDGGIMKLLKDKEAISSSVDPKRFDKLSDANKLIADNLLQKMGFSNGLNILDPRKDSSNPEET